MPGADRDGLTAGPADRLQAVGGAIVALDRGLGHMSKKDAGADLGIWQRWSAYANPMDPTGGNKEFKAIVAEHGTGYIMENFTYSILEVCDTKMTTAEVCERESHWKDVLCSRKFGMNWN